MIFDIERLIKAADHRDQTLTEKLQEQLDRIDAEILDLTTQHETGRQEMLKRAEKLVETLKQRPVTAGEMQIWFAGQRGALLTASPSKVRLLEIARERFVDKHHAEARIGELQQDLRVMLDQGKEQVSEKGLQAMGYWNSFKLWMDRYNAAQRGARL